MNVVRFAILLLFLHVPNLVQAAEPTGGLDEDLAKRLIAEVLEIRPGGITVATVLKGEKRAEEDFVERHVSRVTAIHPVLVDGRLVRRVQYYDFSWNQRFGWFYKRLEETRSGEEIKIWSEREGEVVVR